MTFDCLSVREYSAGDLGVLANCKSLSKFDASETRITGEFPAPFFQGTIL